MSITFHEFLKTLPTLYQAHGGHELKAEMETTLDSGLLTNVRIWIYDNDKWSIDYYHEGNWLNLTSSDIDDFIFD